MHPVPRGSPLAASHLTGPTIVLMMRKHRRTIRGLANAMGITQKRVRQVRAEGVYGLDWAWDWLEAITQEPWTQADVSGQRAAAYVACLYCHPRRRIPPASAA